jgi:hypothetical protein
MYTHISKGFTLGHVLTRRLLRFITSAPGAVIDLLAAVFWTPNYTSYWENYIPYGDGVKAGIFEGLFGWIGEVAGYIVGGTAGAVIGFALFFPDGIIRGASWLYNQVCDGLNKAANLIGEREAFKKHTYKEPKNYLQKSWNLSVGTLGSVIGVALAIIPRVIEFILPVIGNTASTFAWNAGKIIGGAIGMVVCTPLYIAKHLTDRFVSGYQSLRNGMRSFAAFVYAKGKQNLYNVYEAECVSPSSVHSQEFKNKYQHCKQTSTTELIFGKIRQGAEEREPKAREVQNDGVLDDPISQERLVDPVIDGNGHTFSRGTISKWLEQHNTCPLGNETLVVGDLVPNRVVSDLLARR